MLDEIEVRFNEQEARDAREQLELFGALLDQLSDERAAGDPHRVEGSDGRAFEGTWVEIVEQMRDATPAASPRTVHEYMQSEARRGHSLTGQRIPTGDAEEFGRLGERVLRREIGMVEAVSIDSLRELGASSRAGSEE